MPPPDFFLFPRLKSSLKEHHFGTVKNVLQAAVTKAVQEIPVQDFQASYDAWQNRWKRCIDAQGCYFEEYQVCVNIYSIKRIFSNQSRYFPDMPCISVLLLQSTHNTCITYSRYERITLKNWFATDIWPLRRPISSKE